MHALGSNCFDRIVHLLQCSLHIERASTKNSKLRHFLSTNWLLHSTGFSLRTKSIKIDPINVKRSLNMHPENVAHSSCMRVCVVCGVVYVRWQNAVAIFSYERVFSLSSLCVYLIVDELGRICIAISKQPNQRTKWECVWVALEIVAYLMSLE